MTGLLRRPLRDLERPSGLITVEESSPLADGLIAWWPLSPEYSGLNIVGSPPSEGTITAPGWQTEQGFGNPLAGAGSTWVDTGSNLIDDIALGFEADKPFSISIWSKIPTSVSAMFAKASSSVTANKTFHFFHQSGEAARTPRLDIRGTSNDTSWGWMDDLWHRYMITWDGTTGLLYGDGGDQIKSLTIGTSSVVTTNVTIGCRTASSPGTVFTGRLLDCQVWRRALSPAEVQLDYAPETRWGLYWRPSPKLIFPVLVASGVAAGSGVIEFNAELTGAGPVADGSGVIEAEAELTGSGQASAGQGTIEVEVELLGAGSVTSGSGVIETEVQIVGAGSSASGSGAIDVNVELTGAGPSDTGQGSGIVEVEAELVGAGFASAGSGAIEVQAEVTGSGAVASGSGVIDSEIEIVGDGSITSGSGTISVEVEIAGAGATAGPTIPDADWQHWGPILLMQDEVLMAQAIGQSSRVHGLFVIENVKSINHSVRQARAARATVQ